MREDPNAEYYHRTGGYPVNQILVVGDETEPQIMAYVTDAEDDVFRAVWNGETLNLQTEDMSHFALSKGTLKVLLNLEKMANNLDEYMFEARQHAEEKGDIPDFAALIARPRPKDENGQYVPKGVRLPAPQPDSTDVSLSQQVENEAGRNIAFSTDDAVEALRAKRAFMAAGRQVVVINEVSEPMEEAKKNALMAKFGAAEQGTMALVHLTNPYLSIENDADPEADTPTLGA